MRSKHRLSSRSISATLFAAPVRSRIALRTNPRRDFIPTASSRKSAQLLELLILQGLKCTRISTSKIRSILCKSLILSNLNPTRINTCGAKDLKSLRINTSGNKDLKSSRINTSKKQGRGGAIWLEFSFLKSPAPVSLKRDQHDFRLRAHATAGPRCRRPRS